MHIHQRTRSRRWLALSLICIGAAAMPRAGRCAEQEDWQARFEARVQELRAQGEPITFEEVLARREKMPDEENSALVFLQAFERTKPIDDDNPWGATYVQAFAPQLGVRRSDPIRQLNRRWLEENAEALALIHEGAKRPRGRYPIQPAENPFAIELSHLGSLRNAVRLCTRAAVFHAEEGDAEAAADDLFAARRLAASLGDCVFLINALVRIAADAIFVEGLERTLALCEMPADRLALVREEIAREEQELSLTQAFFAERAGAHYVFTAPADKVLREMSALVGGRLPRRAMRPSWRARDALHYYDLIAQAIRVSRMPARQKLKEARERRARLEEVPPGRPISAMLMPGFGRALEEEVKAKTKLRVARAALAVEQWRLRYGQWPDSLDQLVPEFLGAVPEDPFSDRTLRYARRETGAVVYSVGTDGADDGGSSRAEAEEEAGRVLQEGWDIVFRLLDSERRGARTLTLQEEVTSQGVPALHVAVQMGHSEVVGGLLKEGIDVDVRGPRGRTALHLAAQAGLKEMAQLLLANGAEVNAVDNEGSTPTSLAAQAGHRELADLLGEHGGVE